MDTFEDQQRVWLYFLVAYLITWGLSAYVTYLDVVPPVRGIGSLLLHYGPTLAAILLAVLIEGRAGLRNLFSGLGRWRVGIKWYLFIFLFPVFVRILAVGINNLMGGTWKGFFKAQDVPAGNPLVLFVPVFLAVLLQAGIAEEIGWRGYALPRLQTKYNALVSSLILGVVWTLWHYHPQNFPGLRGLGIWYPLSVLPLTILMTWVYNNTNGSLLLMVLFHTASNVSDWIVPIRPGFTSTVDMRSFIIQVILMWAIALVVMVKFGVRDFVKKEV